MTLIGCLAFICSYGVHRYVAHPSRSLCLAIAEIGATLLIAYTVSINWNLERSRTRGAGRENWVGFVAGTGACALLGLAIALGLADGARPLTWLASLVFSWSAVSIGVLGVWVALLPWPMYHWTHWSSTEYRDE